MIPDPRVLRLIAITDDLRDGPQGLLERARAAERGGATCVQLRLKDVPAATQVEVARALVAALHVPVIVNDRLDVALAAGAAGVHLGPDDLPVADVRALVGEAFILGTSVGCEAEIAGASATDYVGIGAVYATDSKADAGAPIGVAGFARLASMVDRPAVAIGGITADNVRPLVDAGAVGVAVIRAVFGAPDPEAAARVIRAAMAR